GEWLWHLRWPGLRGDARGSVYRSPECGVVSKVVCASPPSAGGHRRPRPFDQRRAGEQNRCQTERRHPEIGRASTELQHIWDLAAFAGLSRRFADAPVLPDRAWGRWRRLRHGIEVLLRRQFRDPEPGGARQRWPVARSVHW